MCIVVLCQLALAGAYALLLLGVAGAVAPLALLGAAWGVSHSLFWGVVPSFCPAERLAVAGGYLGVAINVGPTLVPLTLGGVEGGSGGAGTMATRAMLLLSGLSSMTFAAVVATLRWQVGGESKDDAELEQLEKAPLPAQTTNKRRGGRGAQYKGLDRPPCEVSAECRSA
jgi:hypothetical protein